MMKIYMMVVDPKEKDLDFDFDIDNLTVPRILRNYENNVRSLPSHRSRASGDSLVSGIDLYDGKSHTAKIRIDKRRSRSSDRSTSSDRSSLNVCLAIKRLQSRGKNYQRK